MDNQEKIARGEVMLGSVPGIVWGYGLLPKVILVIWQNSEELENAFIEELAKWAEANEYQTLSIEFEKIDNQVDLGEYWEEWELYISPQLAKKKGTLEDMFSCKATVFPELVMRDNFLEEKRGYKEWLNGVIRLKLETERLCLSPLTPKELEGILQGEDRVEASVLTDIIKNAIAKKIENLKKAPEEVYAWFTYFLITEKTSKRGIGLIGTKGLPDEEGIAEIGYAMAQNYRNRGYMTEALDEILQWLYECSACVGAEVNILSANAPSLKVAKHCGFSYAGMRDIYKVYQKLWEESEDE